MRWERTRRRERWSGGVANRPVGSAHRRRRSTRCAGSAVAASQRGLGQSALPRALIEYLDSVGQKAVVAGFSAWQAERAGNMDTTDAGGGGDGGSHAASQEGIAGTPGCGEVEAPTQQAGGGGSASGGSAGSGGAAP